MQDLPQYPQKIFNSLQILTIVLFSIMRLQGIIQNSYSETWRSRQQLTHRFYPKYLLKFPKLWVLICATNILSLILILIEIMSGVREEFFVLNFHLG